MMGIGLGGLWMVIIWIAIIGLSIWALASLFPGVQGGLPAKRRENPLAILKERYARGDLSRDEYKLLRQELE